ncbi:NDR1/HIN1-like protein 12 [Cryptomeria japonica]|uniref:NDR1/HIN1-like protein 12 n=1 Tax=Cryptomeria japonica TaxID=3369 RepID=UPI0027DA3293|nr:NDR1/HIN1-like protein 12 [Cryptomeria japonica]
MTKDCGKHSHGSWDGFPREKFWRGLCGCLLFLIIIVLFVILIIYLALRPHKPRFYVQDAVIRQWNLTGDDTLTSSLQFTIISRNPNDRIGVYYDRISGYANYLGQQISPYSPLMPFYQGHNDINVISPVLYGASVPLAPFVADHLRSEQQNGILTVNLRIGGKVRWKVGTWTSGHYRLNVNCYAILGFTSCCNGGQAPLQAGTRCDVDV